VLTATTAAKLAARGQVDLDAPISNWLKDLPAPHRQTTLKQLLTHRGGVRHYTIRDLDRAAPGGALDFRAYPTNKEILETFINDPLIGPVGAQIAYSTFGYTLASLVLETAAGQHFPKLVKAEIGAPFGLTSLAEDDPQALRPMRVSGYGPSSDYRASNPLVDEGWANARQTNPAYKWAGGGFLMTPSDIARFGAALLDSPQSRVTREERALLFTPLTAATRQMPPLGLAWRLDADQKGRRRWHHAGAQEGGRASLVVYPDLGISIAFATNVATVPTNVLDPSSELADAFS
jgi:CubicO group peptidase (beta-lactamase class C family)